MVVVGDKNLVSLSELCKQLSISVATGRNWLKLGKINQVLLVDKVPYFTQDYVLDLKRRIAIGENAALKSRRNKKYVSGNELYSSYVSAASRNIAVIQSFIQAIKALKIELTDELISTIIVYFARQVISVNAEFLIQDIINNFGYSSEFIKKHSELFNVKLFDEPNEDILGLLYISLKSLGDRKSKGAYYTPTSVVKKLISNVFDNIECSTKTVLDPCCGTGNFILQLPNSFVAENVYASDIDLMSVLIARINFSKRFNVLDKNLIYKNIYQCDYLDKNQNKKYDYIIGNPPWGSDFSTDKKQKLRKKYKSALGANIESYDVVVEQALSELSFGGTLAFVLPESFLNVKTHTPIRKFLMKENSITSLEYLGEVFNGVQCPSVIIQILHNGKTFSTKGMRVNYKDNEFIISSNRDVSAECFNFLMNDEQYLVLEKILNINNKVYLKNNARFALGIVTGNNSKYLSEIKNAENEVVLKGADIKKFFYNTPQRYICFTPNEFQQVAPIDLYRAEEKLVYKFISNKLVFAYDNKQTLSLNSCNILIPEIAGLSVKYIMAVLNSSVAQFIFNKQYNSIKVLRSHIEQIPIPYVEESEQKNIESYVDKILNSKDENYQKWYNILDEKISRIYSLTDEEISLISC